MNDPIEKLKSLKATETCRINIHTEQAIVDRLDALCEAHNISRSGLITELLRIYLDSQSASTQDLSK